MSKKSPIKQPEDPIVVHARRELALAGMFNKTADYDGLIGKATLVTIKTFIKVTHGDPDAMEAVYMAFTELTRGQLLSSPTDNPTEWLEMKGAKPMIWQNKRSPFYRSADHGKTWYHTGAPAEVHPSANHLTGEVPEDENIAVQENTNDGSDGEGVEKPAESTGSDSPSKSVQGQRLDEGVADQSPEDAEGSQSTEAKPPAGETS